MNVSAGRSEGARRRILIVAMQDSVHVARWLSMVSRGDTAVVVFPVYQADNVVAGLNVIPLSEVSADLAPGAWVVRRFDIDSARLRFKDTVRGYRRWRHDFLASATIAAPDALQECILRFRPELVHSMEVQLAGYLCLETSRRMGRRFPPWILSNWGSDIALFRKFAEHQSRLRAVCSRIDYYLPECMRDQSVAREFGYRGPELPVIPASGGVDVDALASPARSRPSVRRKILVKGYHGWSGRAALALSAIALARYQLADYEIEVSLAAASLGEWTRRLSAEFGLQIRLSPYLPNHSDAINRLAEARVVMGMGISDGISTTLLEAMLVGTFPIQSSTACADEWIEHGRSGFIVSPHDTSEVAEALLRAVNEDRLVDEAAEINLRTVRSRWSAEVNGGTVWNLYDLASGRAGRPHVT